MRMARNPKVKEADRKGAAQVVLAYGFGEPAKTMELGGIGGGPIRMSSADEKKQALESLLEGLVTRLPEGEESSIQ